MELKLREKLCKGVTTPEEENVYRKVEKVVAPFLRTLKKRKHEKADVMPAAYEELYLKKNPKELLSRLQSACSDALEFRTLMNETAELLKVTTRSKSVNLYFTDYDRGEILLCPKFYESNIRFQKKYDIGTYVAAHVAFTKEYVISSDIMGDVRFPLGIPNVPVVKSVLCVPIITNVKENCIGVIELYRECSDKPYDLANLQICNALTAWMGIAMEQNTARMNLFKEMEIQNQFSQLAELYFSGIIPFNKVVSDLLKLSKAAVFAEKGAFYVFREPVPVNTDNVLLADAFEEGLNPNDLTEVYKKRNMVSFSKNQPGIAGYSARTGEVVNVFDAYKDHRFDRRTDPPGYRTRSVVAFPAKSEAGVLAVLKLINSMEYPHFRQEDIQLVNSFLYQIILICEFFFLSTAHSKTQLKLVMVEKLLDFYSKPSAEEVNDVKTFIQGEQQIPPGFLKFEWDLNIYEEDIIKYSAYIFLCPDILEPCFEIQNLADFLLRVKKSYRPLLYHNLEHAFCVLHFAFNFLLRNKDTYTAAEIVALLLAALCHDVDHTGFTNTFLSLQNDTVYKLYGDLCGEQHRNEVVLFLIQQSDLLSHVSAQNYKFICRNLKRLIMSFDMAVYFENRNKITHLINVGAFNWEDPEHRFLTQNMMLVCSDYGVCFKSFEVVKKNASTFCKELYKQGDLEKMMGFSPLPMMDRNKIDMYPENQIILMSVVVLPIVDVLTRIFHNLNILHELLRHTMKKWNEILEFRGLEMWKVNEALVKDRKEKRGSNKITVSSTLSSIKTVLSDTRSIRSKL